MDTSYNYIDYLDYTTVLGRHSSATRNARELYPKFYNTQVQNVRALQSWTWAKRQYGPLLPDIPLQRVRRMGTDPPQEAAIRSFPQTTTTSPSSRVPGEVPVHPGTGGVDFQGDGLRAPGGSEISVRSETHHQEAV